VIVPVEFTPVEFEAWRAAQELPDLSPDELLQAELPSEQHRWLALFILLRDLYAGG
jgi:hypothetical protein